MTGKEIGAQGSVVRALFEKVGSENNEWERTVTSSIYCQDLQSTAGKWQKCYLVLGKAFVASDMGWL